MMYPARKIAIFKGVKVISGTTEAIQIREAASLEEKNSPQGDQRTNNNNRGRGFSNRGRGYDPNSNGYGNNFGQGRGRPFQRRPWRSRGFQPRGRGFAPQSGTGDPGYKCIPQYKYVCGVCRNRGHYDHQCHTLQHLAHAMQAQQAQTYNYNNNNDNDQDHNKPQAF